MVSQISNIGSDGHAIDHEGFSLEDDAPGSGLPLLGPLNLRGNPAFGETAPYEESNMLGAPMEIFAQDNSEAARSDEAQAFQNGSRASDGTSSPGEATAAVRASENAQLFKAAFQINSNERERAILASKRVMDLQDFLKNEVGVNASSEASDSDDVKSKSNLLSLLGPVFNNGFDLGDIKSFIMQEDEKLLDVAQAKGSNGPIAPLHVSSSADVKSQTPPVAGMPTWSNVVKKANCPAELLLDYCPMPTNTSIVSPSPMDNLPDHLILLILSRLNDSSELGRCRCVSKTLNRLARQVRSIHLYCSVDRYTKMRSMSEVIPFKTFFLKLVSDAEVPIESISLGVDKSVRYYDYGFEEHCDDLFLTDTPFIASWMTKIGHSLKSISISDTTAQSYFKKTNIFELLSLNCHNLIELMLGNTMLLVEDMHPMPMLTRLTLNGIEIFDSHLNKLMECLPCLQVFNMINGREDSDPKIHHLNLKELKWILDFALDFSSVVIFAPNLTKLELQCGDVEKVSINAPLLSYLDLFLESTCELNVDNFSTLKTFRLVSSGLHSILSNLPSTTTVQNLTLDSVGSICDPKMIQFCDVFSLFPNVTSLTLASEVWSQPMFCPFGSCYPATEGFRSLKQIVFYLVLDDIDKALTIILYLKKSCSKLTDMLLFIDNDVDLSVSTSFVSLCSRLCPTVRFKWGTWKEALYGSISKSIVSAANAV